MADEKEVEKLKNLPPEERIALLKKLEERRKKEIEQVEALINRSEKEIQVRKETEKEIEEKSRELLEKKVSPERAEELEEIVEEAKKTPETEFNVQYGAPLEEIRRMYQIATPEVYEGIRELRNRASEGRLTEDEERRLVVYENEFAGVNEAYVNDAKTKETIKKAKSALDQIKKYELTW